MPNALQSALEKLCPANYPRIDKHHAAWYPSLPILLMVWVARGSFAFQDLQLFFAQFESTLDMPPPNATPTAKPPQETPIVDLTGADDPVISALPLKASESVLTEAPVSVNRDTGLTPDGVPPVVNGFLTWLNAVEDKKVGGLACAFHLAMQLVGCDVPNFPHDSLRRQWERLRASLPLKPTVTQAVADFVKAHPQDDPFVPAAGQSPAVQAQKINQSMGSRSSGGLGALRPSCNVQWTPLSDPPSQPMCARVLAGFLCSHFHDNLCTVLDEYVRAEVSFANLGVRQEARALVEQGGTVTWGGWRVQGQKSYRQLWTLNTSPGKGGSTHRSAPGVSPAPTHRGSGAAAAPPAPAPVPTSG